MAGQPKWQEAERWLMINPQASARELRNAIGCARSTAHHYIKKWRAMNTPAEDHPAPDLKMRRSRIPIESLPALSRERVVEEMQRTHSNIKLINERLGNEAGDLIPAHLAQMTGALQNLVKAAQLLGDSYPGLAALVMEQDDREGAAVLDDDLETAGEWLNLVAVEAAS